MSNAVPDTPDTIVMRDPGNVLARFSQHSVGFAERYFPDAYVFVLIAVMVIAVGAVVHGGSPLTVSRAFGDGFWSLIPFTMQMALVAIGGYVVAMSPPIAALLRRPAPCPESVPSPPCRSGSATPLRVRTDPPLSSLRRSRLVEPATRQPPAPGDGSPSDRPGTMPRLGS